MLRNSFASIESKIHSSANVVDFDYEPASLSDPESNGCVNRILTEFSDFLGKDNDGTGEWSWLQTNKQKEFIDSMMDRDVEAVTSFLTNMFRNEATYGYLSPSYLDAIINPNQVSSDILNNIDSCAEFTDLANLKQLVSLFGNPYGLVEGNGAILPDTPRHFYYSHNINRLLESDSSPYIVEIGGGYGGLCLQNWRRFNGKCTIVSVDLLPSLIATYFFLDRHGIPVNLITQNQGNIKENSVNLICATDCDNLSEVIPKCDLIFNSRSLCEMGADTVATYFKFINNCETTFFYHENSNFLLFPDSERHIEVLADDFPIDTIKFRLQSKYITPFTGGDGRYREYVYKVV